MRVEFRPQGGFDVMAEILDSTLENLFDFPRSHKTLIKRLCLLEMLKEKRHWKKGVGSGFFPINLLGEEPVELFPLMFERVFLVAKVCIKSRAPDPSAIDQILHRDVVKALLFDQIDQRAADFVSRAARATIGCLLLRFH